MTVLSETLCTLRKQKNIAQKDVAQALNISNASYNMYEKRETRTKHRNPSKNGRLL